MKHYNVATDEFIEVSPLYKLYWHFCYRKFKLKAWILRKIIILFGQGAFEEVLAHPNDGVLTVNGHYHAKGVAYLWFNGPRGG